MVPSKVHCFFEQSGIFKREFIKLGYPSFDYDIENRFSQVDFVIDLFTEIDLCFDSKPSIFDSISSEDLILSFFPCINFSDAKTLVFKGVSTFQKNWSLDKLMRSNLDFSRSRQLFYEKLLKLVSIVGVRNLKMVLENPWNTSGSSFLQQNFISPTFIDHNRSLRGDYFVKPTAYWFFGFSPTYGFSYQKDKVIKSVYKVSDPSSITGHCDLARSSFSSDYARNFICDFILGRSTDYSLPLLFPI